MFKQLTTTGPVAKNRLKPQTSRITITNNKIDTITSFIQNYNIHSLQGKKRIIQTINKNIEIIKRVFENLKKETYLTKYIYEVQNAKRFLPTLGKLSIICNMLNKFTSKRTKEIQYYMIEIYSANLYLKQINPSGSFDQSFYGALVTRNIKHDTIMNKLNIIFQPPFVLIQKLNELIKSMKTQRKETKKFVSLKNTNRNKVRNPSRFTQAAAGVLNTPAKMLGFREKNGYVTYKGQLNQAQRKRIETLMKEKRNKLNKQFQGKSPTNANKKRISKELLEYEKYLLSRAGFAMNSTGTVTRNNTFRNKINARRSWKNKLKSSNKLGTGKVGMAQREQNRRRREKTTLNELKEKATSRTRDRAAGVRAVVPSTRMGNANPVTKQRRRVRVKKTKMKNLKKMKQPVLKRVPAI